MSEQATSPAEAPSPAPAPVAAPAPAAAAPASAPEGIFNAAEIAAIEAANAGTLAPAKPKVDDYAPAGMDAPASAPAEPAASAPAADPVADPADDADPLENITHIKIKPTSFQDLEVLRLMKPRGGQPGLSMQDAFAKVYGAATPAPTTPAAEPAKAPPAAPAPDAEVTALEAEITKLTADAAAEDMDIKTATKLNREVDAKTRKLERIQSDRAAQAKAAEAAKATAAETTFRQKEIAASKEVYTTDPELANPASPRRAEFDTFVKLWGEDPDNEALVSSPRWPVLAYRDFVEAKGPGKAAAPARAPAMPAPPATGAAAAPRVTAATALVPGDTPGGATEPTPGQLLASLDGMGVDQLRALLPTGRR
jgi:hypothetical protein